MKKLLILLMAFSLFTACNNEKGARNDRDSRTNSRDKDDYRNEDDRDKDKTSDRDDRDRDDDRTSDDRNTDDRDNDRTSDRDDDRKSSGWSSKDVDDFVSSCVSTAVSGMSRTQAENYCECMQVKLERLYPNPNDAANIDVNSSSMQKMVKDCLE